MKTTVQKELESITEKHGGVLRAEDVLEFARDKKTALHGRFEWNNGNAAHEYRLWQARNLIRLYVVPADTEHGAVKVRRFVSLTTDRKSSGGGYRTLAEVINNKDLYQQMLADALDELERMQEKYQKVAELRPVFDAAQKVRSSTEPVTDNPQQIAQHA